MTPMVLQEIPWVKYLFMAESYEALDPFGTWPFSCVVARSLIGEPQEMAKDHSLTCDVSLK